MNDDPEIVLRPRVVLPDVPGPMPLVDEINEIDSAQEGLVAIVGPVGSGKSVAIKYLCEHFAGSPFIFVDDLDRDLHSRVAYLAARGHVPIVYASRQPLKTEHLRILELAPWNSDDHIDYLRAKSPSDCARVLQRVRERDTSALRGNPELWRILLDALLAGETGTTDSIFFRRFDALPPEPRELILKWCFASVLSFSSQSQLIGNKARAELRLQFNAIRNLHAHGVEPSLTAQNLHLLEHPFVQRLLAADFARQRLLEKNLACYAVPWPREMVAAVGAAIADDTAAVALLAAYMRQPELNTQPMLASLLIHAHKDWIPAAEDYRCYEGAILDGAQWPNAELGRANFIDASLANINLEGADLQQARFQKSKLPSATLREATLTHASFEGARLARADFSLASAELASFTDAILADAKLAGANFAYAHFVNAYLRRADFSGARLSNANLSGADCGETDFSRADLTKAQLNGLDLRTAKLTGANFQNASFCESNLEYVELPDARMPGADFSNALLTGSILREAALREANFLHAALAEIEWEYADLRGANFTGVLFHMGSTRTGHVNSTIACEGSKTGFYTDDYEEQSFRAPEAIRKASLRGADLRGAKLQDADFYLVDLRDARIDPGDIPHLRRCGAILEQKKYRA